MPVSANEWCAGSIWRRGQLYERFLSSRVRAFAIAECWQVTIKMLTYTKGNYCQWALGLITSVRQVPLFKIDRFPLRHGPMAFAELASCRQVAWYERHAIPSTQYSDGFFKLNVDRFRAPMRKKFDAWVLSICQICLAHFPTQNKLQAVRTTYCLSRMISLLVGCQVWWTSMKSKRCLLDSTLLQWLCWS